MREPRPSSRKRLNVSARARADEASPARSVAGPHGGRAGADRKEVTLFFADQWGDLGELLQRASRPPPVEVAGPVSGEPGEVAERDAAAPVVGGRPGPRVRPAGAGQP